MGTNPTPQLIHDDHPIKDKNGDKLNRAKFAAGIARSIENWPCEESLVVALYGEWGSGKTSVKNMVVESFTENSFEIVEFNPWQFSGSDQLCKEFFDVLSAQKPVDAAQRLRKYGKYLNFGGKVLQGLSIPASLLATPAAGAIFTALGKAAETSGEIAEAGAKSEEKQPETLTKIKEEIKKDFITKKKTLVIIDDIDRLTTDEINLLIRIIKANTDFPNIVFFLLMERERVEMALGKIVGEGKGSKFLEKIVQLPITLPKPRYDEIYKIATNGIRDIFERLKILDEFNEDYFNIIFEQLQPYFTNLRRVYRCLNQFRFSAVQFKTDHTFEIDYIDFIAIETLKIFEPKVYEFIYNNKAKFLSEEWRDNPEIPINPFNEEMEKLKTNIDEDLVLSKRKVLLQTIFPFIAENDPDFCSSDKGIRNRQFFDRYFLNYVLPEHISEEDVYEFTSALNDKEKMLLLLNKWEREERLSFALPRLNATSEFKNNNIPLPSLLALFEKLDSVPEGLFSQMKTSVLRHFIDLIRKKNAMNERKTFAEQMIAETNSLLAPLMIITKICPLKETDLTNPIFDANTWKELKEQMESKLKTSIEKETFPKNERGGDVFAELFELNQLGSPMSTVENKISIECIKSPKSVIKLLQCFNLNTIEGRIFDFAKLTKVTGITEIARWEEVCAMIGKLENSLERKGEMSDFAVFSRFRTAIQKEKKKHTEEHRLVLEQEDAPPKPLREGP